jgi:hypothetical protein
MKHKLGPFLVALVVFSVPFAWSQTGTTDQSQSDSTDQSQPSSTGPQVAFTHPEQLPPLALLNEATADTGLQLGFSTGTTIDTNAGGFSLHPILETWYFFRPNISVLQIRSRVVWSLAYQGGFQVVPQVTQFNSMSHNGTADVLYQLNRHWQVHAHDSYMYTADPFESFDTINGTPRYNDPNPSIYVPLAIREQNLGTADLTDQLGIHDSITFAGTEFFRRYLNTTVTTYDSYGYSGRASYQHQFSARLSAGGGYIFQALDFDKGVSRSGIQTFQGTVSYQLSPNMYVTGWIGPEYTSTKNVVPTFCFPGYGCFGYHATYAANWDIAGGATFGWSGVHNAFRAGFSKSVTDGGGVLGTVRLYLLNASYRRQVSPRWALTTGVLYGNNLSVSYFSSPHQYNSLTANMSLQRRLSPAWNVLGQYIYIHQYQHNLYGSIPTWNDNRIQISLQYAWSHSLGR